MWKVKWMLGILFSAGLYNGSRNLLRNPLAFYSQLFIKLVDDRPRLVRLKFVSGKVFYAYRFMDLFKFYEIFIEDDYRTDASDLKLVVDIGGNKGYFSLRIAAQYPNAEFHCYEPEPGNFSNLTKQLKDNNLNFTAFQEGVSGEDGEMKLYVNPKNDGGHSLFGSTENGDHVMVKISSFASVIRRLPAGATIDLLKLDCEGAERDIILSITPQQARHVREIFYEPTHKLYNPALLNAHLQNLGFRVRQENGIFKASKKAAAQPESAGAEFFINERAPVSKPDGV